VNYGTPAVADNFLPLEAGLCRHAFHLDRLEHWEMIETETDSNRKDTPITGRTVPSERQSPQQKHRWLEANVSRLGFGPTWLCSLAHRHEPTSVETQPHDETIRRNSQSCNPRKCCCQL
jgi:hypothetical protein